MVGSKSFIAALAGLTLLCSCATPLAERFSCSNSDWYEIGRRDGASGASEGLLDKYHEKCGDRLEPESEDMYRNGRNAGLVEYCTVRNGFELGKMHVAYHSVCPTGMETAFLQSYQKGSRARELEQQNKKLETRIEQLAQELSGSRAVASDDKASISTELRQLKNQHAENKQELEKISR